MSRAALVKQAELTRALKAAEAAGMKPSGYEIAPDGTVRVHFGTAGAGHRNSFDGLSGQ